MQSARLSDEAFVILDGGWMYLHVLDSIVALRQSEVDALYRLLREHIEQAAEPEAFGD